MKLVCNYFNKEFSEIKFNELGQKISFALLISANSKIDESEILAGLENGLKSWVVFGENAKKQNDRLDAWARSYDCDAVPEWSWVNKIDMAVNQILKNVKENNIYILASKEEVIIIKNYLDSIKEKKLSEIKTIDDVVDNSANSRFVS